jgi:hypothetical protein
MRYIIMILLLSACQRFSYALDSTLILLQHNIDEQEKLQKTLDYSYSTVTYVHKLDKQGGSEKTDSSSTWQKFRGDSLQEYTLLYSSEKKEEKNEGKKRHSESILLPSLNDSTYDFIMDRALAKIKFAPKKPKKGALAGEISYDPQTLMLNQIKAEMPKMKWPVKEFEMDVKFIQLEGFIFPAEFRMQAGWNALVTKGRIRVESKNFDYKIYR